LEQSRFVLKNECDVSVGLLHNRGLELIYNELKNNPELLNGWSYGNETLVPLTKIFLKTVYENDELESALLGAEEVNAQVQLADRDYLAYISNCGASNEVKEIIIEMFDFNNSRITLESVELSVKNAKIKAEKLNRIDKEIVLYSSEIYLYSCYYWSQNATKWFKLFDETITSDQTKDFWVDLGKGDAIGAVTGAMAGAIAGGGVGAGPGALGGGLIGSAAVCLDSAIDWVVGLF